MFYKRIIPFVLSFVFLAGSILYVSGSDKELEVSAQEPIKDVRKITVEKPKEEIRGVWVTYMTLDVEGETDKETAFNEKIDTIIADMENADLNTMICSILLSEKQMRNLTDNRYMMIGYASNEAETLWVLLMARPVDAYETNAE